MDPMPEDAEVFDVIQLQLILAVTAEETAVAAARAALDAPAFLGTIERAVQSVLAAEPALAVLAAHAEW